MFQIRLVPFKINPSYGSAKGQLSGYLALSSISVRCKSTSWIRELNQSVSNCRELQKTNFLLEFSRFRSSFQFLCLILSEITSGNNYHIYLYLDYQVNSG